MASQRTNGESAYIKQTVVIGESAYNASQFNPAVSKDELTYLKTFMLCLEQEAGHDTEDFV